MSLFTAVERPRRLPEEVARSLAAAIADGRLRPGDRLPTEQSLAAEFGVARTVVREAISQLKYDGVVESRQGVGAFVARPARRTAFRIGPACFAKRKELLKLLQLRTGVAAEAAALAAVARTEPDLEAMRAQLAAMAASHLQSKEGAERRVATEAAFYGSIAAASRNDYFVSFLAMIDGQIFERLHSVAVKNAMAAEWGDQVLDEHRAVLQAIERGDPVGAAAATRCHYQRAAERLARRADFADV